MKKITIITAAILLIAATAVFAGRHGGRGGMDMDRGMGMGPGGGQGHCQMLACAQDLALTDDQVAKIKQIDFAFQQSQIDIRAQLQKARLNLHQEMTSVNPTKAKVLTLTNDMSRIKAQMAEMRVNHRFDLRGILNAEQLQKWNKCRMAPSDGDDDDDSGPGRGMGRKGMRGDGGGQGMRLRDGSCGTGR